MGGFAVTSGARIPHAPPIDPFGPDVIYLSHPNSTFVDSSRVKAGYSLIDSVTLDPAQTIFGNANALLGNSALFEAPAMVTNPNAAYDSLVNESYTMEFWIYLTDYPAGSATFMSLHGPSTSRYFSLSNLGQMTFVDGTSNVFFTLVPLNTWTAIAASFEGDALPNPLTRCYTNGVLDAPLGMMPSVAHSEGVFDVFGDGGGGATHGLNGRLSEVRFTKDVARYKGNTYPLQTAQWPNP